LIVVDASALVHFLLRAPAARAIQAKIFAPGETLHAPHLLDIEVAQVIRRHVANGDIGSDRGQAALADLADLPLQRYPHDLFVQRIWALRNNLTAYDAAYVALAEALGAVLLTRDKRLAAAAGHHAQIDLI
jgi:predicted nucleic acid-binding protein